MARSPEAGVAKAISRPNPTEQPVINLPRSCVPRVIPVSFNPSFTEVNGCLGASWPSNTDYLSRL